MTTAITVTIHVRGELPVITEYVGRILPSLGVAVDAVTGVSVDVDDDEEDDVPIATVHGEAPPGAPPPDRPSGIRIPPLSPIDLRRLDAAFRAEQDATDDETPIVAPDYPPWINPARAECWAGG